MPFLHNFKCKNYSYHNWLSEKVRGSGYRDSLYYSEGGIYTGYVKNGRPHGMGKKTKKSLTYVGNFEDNKRNGYGYLKVLDDCENNSVLLKGNWKNNKIHGKGEKIFPNGNYYGKWAYGKRNGLGTMWYNNETLYIGEWKDDLFHGLGSFFYINGNRYEGHWKDGLKHGKGVYYHNKFGQLQVGEWENGICVRSTLEDKFRETVLRPTKYPVPETNLTKFREFIEKLWKFS